MQKTDIMDTFINNLIDQKQFADITPEFREEIAKDLMQRLDEYIMARSLTELSEEEMEQFNKLLDEKKSRAELQQFTMDHIADYPTFLDNALTDFENAYLA